MVYRPNKPLIAIARELNSEIQRIESCATPAAVEILDQFCDKLEEANCFTQVELAKLYPNILSKVFFRGHPAPRSISEALQDCMNVIIDTGNLEAITAGLIRLERVFHFCPDRHVQLLEDLVDSSEVSEQTYDAVLLSFAKCAGRTSRFIAQANEGRLAGKQIELLEVLLRDCAENARELTRTELALNIYFVKDASRDLETICNDLTATLSSDSSVDVRDATTKGRFDFYSFNAKRDAGMLRK